MAEVKVVRARGIGWGIRDGADQHTADHGLAGASGEREGLARCAVYSSEKDKLDRYLNAFATQSFRDQADRDYIAARLTCRYELFPQFLWSSQQALEKYLKAILLYNRVKATKVGHDINEAMRLTEELSFKIELSKRSRDFVDLIATYGQFRYLDVPFQIYGHVLVDLDLTVWELRRYCQVLNVFGKVLPAEEQSLLDGALKRLAISSTEPRYKFRIHNGLLETIIAKRSHPSRSALLWQNPCFSARKRSTVKVKNHLNAQNPHLTHYPQMLEELLKYVYIPDVPPLSVAGRSGVRDYCSGFSASCLA